MLHFHGKVLMQSVNLYSTYSKRSLMCLIHFDMMIRVMFFAVVTREKKVDLERKQSARCVFECRVFGQKGVGKVVAELAVHFTRDSM